MADEPRFDLIHDANGLHLDYHFCRDWEEDRGCYGTNGNHGFSFEDAREQLAQWHEQEAVRVRALSLEQWQGVYE